MDYQGSIFIQPHDFPDPDAVASAFALASLLKHWNIPCEILYQGFIQRQALSRMISALNIPLRHASSYLVGPEDAVIVVDGCPENRNVTHSGGKVIAVIDHHDSSGKSGNHLIDLRKEYGSCSAIITEYWQYEGLIPTADTATALLIGIARDTDHFKRMISEYDLKAFQFLWPLADQAVYYRIIRNNIEKDDRIYYRILMNSMNLTGNTATVYFPEGCPVGMMGILGDFLLSMNDVDFTLIAAMNGKDINVSIRSEVSTLNAASLIQMLLKGRGWGGGHDEMAGGIVPDALPSTYEDILEDLHVLLSKKL